MVIIKKIWAGGVAQVVDHPPSKYKALISSPSTAKKEGKEGREGGKKEGRKKMLVKIGEWRNPFNCWWKCKLV
jgi:hypothetical protein